MIDLESTRVAAYSGMTLVGILGAGLTISVGFAATMPVHEPVRQTLSRLWAWARKAGSVALRGLYVALGLRLAYRLAVTYLHVGWKGQRHAYVTRGRHRPAYVKRHAWRPVLTWSAPTIEWGYAS